MKRTRFARFALLLLGALSFMVGSVDAQPSSIRPAPLNPDFVRYLADLRSGSSPKGFVPSAFVPQRTKSASALARTAPALEKSFDIAQYGWATRVKDQAGWGTCWDFATVEAMESNLKKETGVDYDFSELHLGFFAYYDESADRPAFDQTADPAKKNPIFDNGGTAPKARAILSRGTGPVNEADAPYPKTDIDPAVSKDEYLEYWRTYASDPEALKSRLLATPNRFRLEESLVFTTSDDIKQALKEYGGLWFAFGSDAITSKPYIYSSRTSSEGGHAVLLVGWDDDFPRENFGDPFDEGRPPSSDGAWKIQNSWSLDAGLGGYYWISYEHATIFYDDGAATFVAMPLDSYEHTYSHDPLGMVYALDVEGSSARAANVFTAERDESLVRVGFETLGEGVGYAIQVYRNVPAGGMPDEGTPVYALPQQGIADFSGYRNVALTTPVSLDAGERFAVVITFDSRAGELQIPVEARIDGLTSKAVAKPRESYVKLTGAEDWSEVRTLLLSESDDDGNSIDIHCTNLCIKAFTNAAPGDSSSSGSSGGCQSGAFGMVVVGLLSLLFKGADRGAPKAVKPE